jgi:hypothetical protein
MSAIDVATHGQLGFLHNPVQKCVSNRVMMNPYAYQHHIMKNGKHPKLIFVYC